MKIDEVFKEKIISKISKKANSEIVEAILNRIVKDYEDTDLRFKKHVDSDEIIDVYLFWKKQLLTIIDTEVKTENYIYNVISCLFMDDINITYLTYGLFNGEVYAIDYRTNCS